MQYGDGREEGASTTDQTGRGLPELGEVDAGIAEGSREQKDYDILATKAQDERPGGGLRQHGH